VFWPSHGWMAHSVCCFDNLDHLGRLLAWTWLSEPGSSQVLQWELKLGPILEPESKPEQDWNHPRIMALS